MTSDMRPMQIQAYILGKKEFYEVRRIDHEKGAFVLAERYAYDLGQTLSDFCHLDLNPACNLLREIYLRLQMIKDNSDIIENRDRLLCLTRQLLDYHIYFLVVMQQVLEIIDPATSKDKSRRIMRKMSNIGDLLKEEQRAVGAILQECLDVAAHPQLSVVQRFRKAAEKHSLNSFFSMRSSTLTTEATPLEFDHKDAQQDQEKTYVFVERLEPGSMLDLINYLKGYLLEHEIACKLCKNCGRYFAVTGKNTVEYCNRLIEGTKKTCKEAGSWRNYYKRQLQNESFRIYTKAYKARHAHIRYGNITKEQFREWSQKARRMRDACDMGEIRVEEFIYWIKNN